MSAGLDTSTRPDALGISLLIARGSGLLPPQVGSAGQRVPGIRVTPQHRDTYLVEAVGYADAGQAIEALSGAVCTCRTAGLTIELAPMGSAHPARLVRRTSTL